MAGSRKLLSRWFRGLAGPHRFRKRYDLINYFIRTRNHQRYLEIGTGAGRCFERVRCANKLGVDPAPRRVLPEWNILQMTSDEFFRWNTSRFDVVFIDGLHLSEQVIRDIFHGWAVLTEEGILLVHDCNPATERVQVRDSRLAAGGQWSGDVWKAIAYLRRHVPGLFCRVFAFDRGVGILVPDDGIDRPAWTVERERQAVQFFEGLNWINLERDRKELLGIIETVADFELELGRHRALRAGAV